MTHQLLQHCYAEMDQKKESFGLGPPRKVLFATQFVRLVEKSGKFPKVTARVLPKPEQDERLIWCQQQFENNWIWNHRNEFFFVHEEDAVFFSLTWA